MNKFNVKVKLEKQMIIATRPLMNEISKDIRKTVYNRFRNSTAPDGSQWATVTHRTGKPLWVSGKLARSIERIYDKEKAVVSTSDIRARLHNYGGIIRAKNKPYLHFKIGDRWIKVKEVKIKARPFMGFNQQMEDKYTKDIRNHYEKEIKKKLGGV